MQITANYPVDYYLNCIQPLEKLSPSAANRQFQRSLPGQHSLGYDVIIKSSANSDWILIQR